MTAQFSLDDFKAAKTRLSPYIRQTPTLDIKLDDGRDVSLKLENLQISGSFKIRGALNNEILVRFSS